MVNKRYLIMVGLLVCLALASSVSGQIVYGQPTSGHTGFTFSSWKLSSADTDDETTLSQFWVPVTGFLPVAENTEARFWVASAGNSIDFGDTNESMFGLGDFRVQLSRSFSEDMLVAALGLNLPTGKKELDYDVEQQIIQQLSQNYIEVPMRRYGEGFGFSLMLGAANSYGNASLGGGIRYEYIGKYKPYEGEAIGDYDPGDMFSIYAGGDLVGENSIWSLNLALLTYLDDKLDGEKVFKQGTQFDMQVIGRFGPEDRRFTAKADYLLRDRNKRLVADPDAANEFEQLKLYGNEFFLSADYLYRWPSQWYFSPEASLRMIGANEETERVLSDPSDPDSERIDNPSYIDNSTIFGLGGFVGRPLSEQVSLDLGFKFFTGSADGGDIDLTGFQISAALSATF